MSKQLTDIIKQYHPLLYRYACRLLVQPALASGIITKVFEELYDQDKLVPGPMLRPDLKTATLHKCEAYNKAYAVYEKTLNSQQLQNEKPTNP
ncbi:MAG: hypothetical protein ABIP30_16765 [Ferruginibacter sp.]